MVVENLKMAFGAVMLIGIMIWTLSIFWPEVGDDIAESYISDSGNLILTGTSVDLTGDNCIANSITCINTSGTEAINSGNWTFTPATCSIVAVSGSDYNNTNITCNYDYQSAVSGNFTEMYVQTPARTSTIVTVSLAVLVVIILIGVYGYFARVM